MTPEQRKRCEICKLPWQDGHNCPESGKPLDRGKVSQWITFHRRELYDGTIIIDPDELRDAINSGRLDVEEG